MNSKGLALHTWTLDTTPLAEVLRVARQTGWDAIELRRVDFTRVFEAGQSAAQVLDLVKASDLPVACVGVELGWMFAEGAERQRLLHAFAESCLTDRLPPGRGTVPFPEILHILSAKRYSGHLSYEAPNPSAWARDPEEVAREALQATRTLLPGG